MKINDKEFKDWTEGDLQEIIENDVYRENEFWDYKQTFAVLECQDKESKRKKHNEFRHDICSFANAEGGYLIVGVMEEAGVPTEINGIGISNTDKFELDRRNELSGILPVVPKVEFSFIKLLNGNYVVVIRIYRGMYKPYLYRENEDNYRFYVRRGNRKQAMSYMEIRDDFLHSNLLSEEIGPTKWKKIRVVDFGDTLADILRNAKKEQHKNRFQYGELYQRNFYREVMEKNRVHYEYYHLGMTENVPEDYTEIFFVCLREDGCLELPATIETACRTAGRKVPELEGFHFHTLRHTYTTNLLSNGAQPKDVQELLGHSDVSTTMNVYAHATREAKRTSARLLDKVAGND